MAEYKFNPEQYGFEPVDKFPELAYNYPMGTGKWFIKISEYGNYGRLVYWYHAVFTGVGLGDDDGVEISAGSYDAAKTEKAKQNLTEVKNGKLKQISEYDLQNRTSVEYLGLISNHKFAVELLKHLLGTTKNKSVENEGRERLFDEKGKRMRSEFNYC